MAVTLDRETVKELITFKLQHIQETIRVILDNWQIDNTDDFLVQVKSAELTNA